MHPQALKVQNALIAAGSASQVVELPDSTRTAVEAAAACGCEVGQIVKSLIFRGKTSNKGILVLTSGLNRVDEAKIGQYAGEAIGRADADFVRSVTGFAIGGVPPVGHAQPIETYMDEDLMHYPTVWAAAGTPNAVFELLPSDLAKITQGKVVHVKQE